MLSTARNKNHTATAATSPRRVAAAVLTLLFAFCVLVASAPHRHVSDAWVSRAASPQAAMHGYTLATAVQAADAACPLCDWLYAPTLPAAAPVLPPVALLARHFAPLSPAPAGRLLVAASSRSSSRAPPTLV